MSWLNPVAFLGLLALAVPILAHLFGRRVARRQVFPSLRLLREARPTPATRSTPSDVLLLVVRCAVLVSAVIALAQPRFSNAARARAAQVPVRAILVDTSSSMDRLTSDGTSARQRARTLARALLDSAREGMIVETGRPGSDIGGASSWLGARSGLRELVVVSDFQSGAVTDGDFAKVPAGIGTKLVRVAAEGLPGIVNPAAVQVDADATSTRATWTVVSDTGLAVTVLVADKDRDGARSSSDAIRAIAPRPPGASRRVAVVFPAHAARDSMIKQATRLDSAWQGDFMLSLRRNTLLKSASEYASATPACDSAGVPVVHNARGDVVASVTGTSSGSGHDVLVVACVDVATVAGTALLHAAESALAPVPLWQEMEPTVVPDELLQRWERPAVEQAPRGDDGTSTDGRWLWLLAIALLLLEEWLKRRLPSRSVLTPSEVQRERVA